MAERDVICVGGSVAGATTAALLAGRGLSVTVLEPAEFPREKACGEGILPPGRAVLERLGVRPPGATEIHGIRYRAGRRSADLPFPRGTGLAVRRTALDTALLDLAVRSGAEVVRARALGISPGRVRTDRGEFRARVLVGADGGNSLFHRELGLEVRRRTGRYGLSTHVRGLEAAPDLVEVVFFPQGEVYVAPVGDGVVLTAFLLERGSGVGPDDLPGLLREVFGDRARRARSAGEVHAASPLARTVRPIAGEGWLLVGDSAGSLDPVTGEGMSLALRSAEVAASSIQAQLQGDPGALAGYARSVARLRAPAAWLTRLVLFAARRPRLAENLLRVPRLLRPLVRLAAAGESAPRALPECPA